MKRILSYLFFLFPYLFFAQIQVFKSTPDFQTVNKLELISNFKFNEKSVGFGCDSSIYITLTTGTYRFDENELILFPRKTKSIEIPVDNDSIIKMRKHSKIGFLNFSKKRYKVFTINKDIFLINKNELINFANRLNSVDKIDNIYEGETPILSSLYNNSSKESLNSVKKNELIDSIPNDYKIFFHKHPIVAKVQIQKTLKRKTKDYKRLVESGLNIEKYYYKTLIKIDKGKDDGIFEGMYLYLDGVDYNEVFIHKSNNTESFAWLYEESLSKNSFLSTQRNILPPILESINVVNDRENLKIDSVYNYEKDILIDSNVIIDKSMTELELFEIDYKKNHESTMIIKDSILSITKKFASSTHGYTINIELDNHLEIINVTYDEWNDFPTKHDFIVKAIELKLTQNPFISRDNIQGTYILNLTHETNIDNVIVRNGILFLEVNK